MCADVSYCVLAASLLTRVSTRTTREWRQSMRAAVRSARENRDVGSKSESCSSPTNQNGVQIDRLIPPSPHTHQGSRALHRCNNLSDDHSLKQPWTTIPKAPISTILYIIVIIAVRRLLSSDAQNGAWSRRMLLSRTRHHQNFPGFILDHHLSRQRVGYPESRTNLQ